MDATIHNEEETLDSMARDTTEHVVSFIRAGLRNLLKFSDENNVTEEIGVEIQGQEIAAVSETYEETAKSADLESAEEK